jgi:hypothetical protein
VELVTVAQLAALTTTLSSAPFHARRRDLRRHLDVLEAAFAETTVVPCAFASVLPTRAAVEEELLAARSDELRTLLDRLENRVQLNVKVSYEEDVVLRDLVASDPEIARLNERTRGAPGAYAERVRLGDLVASAFAERRSRDAEEVVDAVAEIADDIRGDRAELPVVLKASFLVRRERVDRFHAALERLAAERAPALRFESVGPLPPTGFASLQATE